MTSELPIPVPPLRSVHTESFPIILQELGISLLVTTYQAGKLVLLRPDRGVLNTHFRSFHSPMGLAADNERIAIGTPGFVRQFRNVPAVGQALDPTGRIDACYLPRAAHVTGDVLIHEMAWAGEELWFVNTRFSCLCTLDGRHSFVPRWRPPFIVGLTPGDHCHLNGLGLVERQPRYVTALGETGTPEAWRANKKDGGILLEVPSGTILARGLSMPHSPRWYDGRLWVLESGRGGIGVVDPRSGRYDCLTELPGFTRGLDFSGPLAFIGLSQVRETAVFSGIPITERPGERNCGIWVVNIHTGQTVAFVKFEDALQEIFAVQVLPGIRFPELINDDDNLILNAYELPDEALRTAGEHQGH
jgi:uncharacterized protein (TIGR03032 family)